MRVLSPCWTSERLVACTMTGHQPPQEWKVRECPQARTWAKAFWSHLCTGLRANMGEKVPRAQQGARRVFMLITVSPQLAAVISHHTHLQGRSGTCLKLHSEGGVGRKPV